MKDLIKPEKPTWVIADDGKTYHVVLVQPGQVLTTGMKNLATYDTEEAAVIAMKSLDDSPELYGEKPLENYMTRKRNGRAE